MQKGVAHEAIRPFLDQLVQYTVNHFQAEGKEFWRPTSIPI